MHINKFQWSWCLILSLIFCTAVMAQQAKKNVSDDDENVVNPRPPSISNPADFLKSGTLQIEYGYEGYYRGRDFRAPHLRQE